MLFLLPIGDDNKDRKIFPWVNYGLIAMNVLVYFAFQRGLMSEEGVQFTVSYATVPKEIVTDEDISRPGGLTIDPQSGIEYVNPGLGKTRIPVYLTLITAMFMHGGFGHLFGNMLYLWVFGDNIEDDLGHGRYLLYYLILGVLAGLTHVFMNAWGPNAEVPCLGASGAIAGVLGSYLILHPHRTIYILVFRWIVKMPAFGVVGLWFLMNVYGGMGTVGEAGGGVAYAAHIGGFIAGLLLVLLFALPKEPPEFVSKKKVLIDSYKRQLGIDESQDEEEWWGKYTKMAQHQDEDSKPDDP